MPRRTRSRRASPSARRNTTRSAPRRRKPRPRRPNRPARLQLRGPLRRGRGLGSGCRSFGRARCREGGRGISAKPKLSADDSARRRLQEARRCETCDERESRVREARCDRGRHEAGDGRQAHGRQAYGGCEAGDCDRCEAGRNPNVGIKPAAAATSPAAKPAAKPAAAKTDAEKAAARSAAAKKAAATRAANKKAGGNRSRRDEREGGIGHAYRTGTHAPVRSPGRAAHAPRAHSGLPGRFGRRVLPGFGDGR